MADAAHGAKNGPKSCVSLRNVTCLTWIFTWTVQKKADLQTVLSCGNFCFSLVPIWKTDCGKEWDNPNTTSINFSAFSTGVSYPGLACFGKFRFQVIFAKFICSNSVQQTLHIAWLCLAWLLHIPQRAAAARLNPQTTASHDAISLQAEECSREWAVQDCARQCAPFIVNLSSGSFNFCMESDTLRELSSAKWRWNISSTGTQFNNHLVEQGWLALRYSKRVPSRAAMEFPRSSMARPCECTDSGHMHIPPSNIPAHSRAMQTESSKHKLLTWPEQARPAYWHQTCMNHACHIQAD